MTPDEFRSYGHRLIDWIADYRTRLAERPVMARTAPGEVKDRLPPSPPERPEDFEGVFRDLERIILPGLSHWQHPQFFGYFPANASLAGVLGDYLSTGLGVLGLSWQASPALTEVEEVVTDWLRQVVGLSDASGGSFSDPNFDGNVGSALLKRFVVTFDYIGQIIYLNTIEPTPADVGTFDRAGWWINAQKYGYEVMDITPGGAASEAGLKLGDLIVTIDGQTVTEGDLSQARQKFRSAPPGTKVALTVRRGTEIRNVTLILREQI